MERPHIIGILHTLRHLFSHIAVTLLAVGVAFSLPTLAEYILFSWWPMVERDSHLLLVNEIIFAAVLVVLFNLFLSARQGRLSHHMNRLISLVHVRADEARWLSRRTRRSLFESIAGTRDVSIMSVTGHDTFVSDRRKLRRVIDQSYELRVMLMNPYGSGAMRRVQSLGDPAPLLETYVQETAATLERLASLVAAGKKITLKFYDDPPFWNLIVTGEHVWVQYCHDGHELKTQPEYVFALHKDKPEQGLFSAFYVHFLNQWDDARHPEYDFASRELIHRDARGNEVKRVPFVPPVASQAMRALATLAG